MRATTTIKRSELYRLVWEQPMLRLAKTYGLSDVGLAKICRKHDIPRPPRGYWAKLQHGQKPSQTPLPKRDHDEEIELRESDQNGSSHLPEDAQQQIEAERQPERRIEVAETLRGCHELVSRANQQLQSARTDEHKMILRPDKPVLDIRTSKTNLRRALLIMDALLKALEQRAYAVASGPTVTIDGTPLRFSLSESLKIERKPREDHDLDGPYEFGHSRFDEQRVPSGQFTLEILADRPYWIRGGQRTWRDTQTKRLEDRLNSFVAGLVQMAARVKEHEEEQRRREEERRQAERRRQEEERRRTERRKLYQAEKARVNELLAQAENYEKSQRVRKLIEAVRAAHEAKGPIEPGSELAKWIEWAHQQADRLDPLRPSPSSILDETDLEEEPRRYGYRW